MSDASKTKSQLVSELAELRQRLAEAAASRRGKDHGDLRETERRYRAIFDNRLQMVFLHDERGLFLEANDAALQRLGYTREDLGNIWFQDIVHPDDLPNVLARMSDMLAKGFMDAPVGICLVARSGEFLWVEAFTIPVEEAGGRHLFIGIARDITDRKRAEWELQKSEERYRVLLESVNDVIYSVDAELTVLSVSPSAERALGYKPEELVGRYFPDLGVLAPEYHERALSEISRVMAGEDIAASEYEFIAKDGSRRWAEVSGAPLHAEDGAVAAVVSVARDITERRKMEEALLLKGNALEDSLNSVAMADMKGNLTYVNKACMRIWGRDSKDDLLGRPYWELVAPPDVDRAREIATDLIRDGSWSGEVVGKRADGSDIVVEVLTSLVRDDKGNPVHTISSFVDITERKRALQALEQSEAHHAAVVQNMSDAVFLIRGGLIVWCNDRVEHIYGYTREEMVGRQVSFLFPSDISPSEYVRQVSRVIRKTGVFRGVTKTPGKDGRPIDFEYSLSQIPGRHPIEVIAVARDVTERRQAEEALKASEERFRALIENAMDAILIIGEDGTLRYQSPAVQRLFGYGPQELVGRDGLSFASPEELPQAASIFSELLQAPGAAVRAELRVLHKDGSSRTVEATAQNLLSDPAVEGIVVNVRDISERRRAETALRESEARFRIASQIATDLVYERDLRTGIATFYGDIDAHMGYDPGAFPRTVEGWIEHVHPDDASRFTNMKVDDFLVGKPLRIEYRMVKKDGTDICWLDRFVMVRDEATGEPVRAVGVATDITERRRSQEALRVSEERHRVVVDNANEMILVSQDDVFKFSNPRAWETLGYSQEELASRALPEVIHPDDREMVIQRQRRRLVGKKSPNVYPFRVVDRAGNTRWVEINSVRIMWEGRPAILNFMSDITERRRTEEELRTILEGSAVSMALVDLTGKPLYINPAAARMLGYSLAELQSLPPSAYLHAADATVDAGLFSELVAGKRDNYYVEKRYVRKGGDVLWAAQNISLVRDHDGAPRHVVSMMEDITERKLAAEEVQRHARRVEVLYAVANIMGQPRKFGELLARALEKITELLGTDTAAVYLVERSQKAMLLKAQVGMHEEAVRRVRNMRLDDEEFQRVLRWQDPHAPLSELFGEARLSLIAEAVESDEALVSATVPFWVRGELEGILGASRRTDRDFSHDEIELLQAIGNEIGVGLESARLLGRTEELAVTDELTGLYNRRHFYELLDKEMSRTQRYGRSFSVAMLDLDGFKAYNDRYGHTVGDGALESFAGTLNSSLRKSDTAFRYGGDEFAVLMPHTDAASAAVIVDRIRSGWLRAPKADRVILDSPLGFSAGIAQFPQDAETADGLVFLADTALIRSKRRGGYKSTLVAELGVLPQDALDAATLEQVYALAATVDARDPLTYGHSKRVATISEMMGKAIGVPHAELVTLRAAALLHDIGKVGVPDAILTKPGKPVPSEWEIIRKHASEGARIVGHVKELEAIVPMIRYHHEWYDGSGYPDGLKGEEIPIGARILSIADAYDTMVTPRPYRDTVSQEEAFEELKRCSGTQFDPALVETFCQALNKDVGQP